MDHVTLFRWVQRFTPILVEAAMPCRHSVGGHWFIDETYVKVSGIWRYVYRAVDQYGQVIDVFVSKRRDLKAATTFFANAIGNLWSAGRDHHGPGPRLGPSRCRPPAGCTARHHSVRQQSSRS